MSKVSMCMREALRRLPPSPRRETPVATPVMSDDVLIRLFLKRVWGAE